MTDVKAGFLITVGVFLALMAVGFVLSMAGK